MRTALAGLLWGLLVLAGPWPSLAGPTPVGAVMGGNVACDPDNPGCQTFPTSASLLCNGTGAILDCPQYFAPDWPGSSDRFFGITNRTNPPRCVQSTDGGTVWGLCPTNPFSAALDNLGSFFTVASDGSLIAAADQGANNCIIRRSTDYGANWTTVFTDTTGTVSCGIAFGSPTPNTLRCASLANYCVVIGRTVSSFNLIAYFSTDNGANWTKGAAFSITSTDEQIGVQVSTDGTQGSLTRYVINYNTAGRTFAFTSGGDWSLTGLIPTPAGEVDGTASRCTSGAFLFNSQSVLCGPSTGQNTTYRYFTHATGIVTFINGVIPSSGFTNAQNPDYMMVGFNAITAYMVGRNTANTQIQINITRDTLASLPLLASLTPATALIAGCCRGDIYLRGARIYFTSGASGANAFLGRIQ